MSPGRRRRAVQVLQQQFGVGILRPDGGTRAGEVWHTICQRGRALRGAEGTLTGHAAGQGTPPVLETTPPQR